MRKQDFFEDMKRKFEPVFDTVKRTGEETIGADKDTTKAIELKEEKNHANNETEDLIKYTINFDLRLIESLGEFANSKETIKFRLRVTPFSKRLSVIKNMPISLHGNLLIYLAVKILF